MAYLYIYKKIVTIQLKFVFWQCAYILYFTSSFTKSCSTFIKIEVLVWYGRGGFFFNLSSHLKKSFSPERTFISLFTFLISFQLPTFGFLVSIEFELFVIDCQLFVFSIRFHYFINFLSNLFTNLFTNEVTLSNCCKELNFHYISNRHI